MTSDGLHRRPRIPHEWAVQYTNNILTHYADFTKCQTDTKYKQDPNQTVLNKVLCMLKRKPYDALWCLTTQSSLNLIMQQYWTSMYTTGNLGFLMLQMIKCCHLWKMQYSQTSQSCGFLASPVPISLIWIHHNYFMIFRKTFFHQIMWWNSGADCIHFNSKHKSEWILCPHTP